MAKLSAHGRTELFRMLAPTPRTSQYAFMSDGKVLCKYSSNDHWHVFKSTNPQYQFPEDIEDRLIELHYKKVVKTNV